MKAAVLTHLNAPLEVCDVEPCPLAFGQVLVRVLAAGICGAQLQEIRGEKGGPLPHLMGHEGCGIVEEVGLGVTRVKTGDKVVMHWRPGAGIESDFPKYRFTTETQRHGENQGLASVSSVPPWFTSGLVTTWAEKTICSENRLTPVPADTPRDLCVMFGCCLSTAMATIEHDAAIRWGERVLVIGCGGLGLSLVHSLHLAYPAHVCACDIHESKRPTVGASADRFVNLTTEDLDGQFDVILDTAGQPDTIERALPRLAPSGRYVMIGQPAPGKPVCISNARHLFEGRGKRIFATQGGGFNPSSDIPRYLELHRQGLLYVNRSIITHRFTLENINKAIALASQGQAGRIVIDMGHPDEISETELLAAA